MLKKIITAFGFVFLFFSAYGDSQTGKDINLSQFYHKHLKDFMRLCHTSDSLIYQQHKRNLLNSSFPLIYDIPQIKTNIPLTTTNIDLSDKKGLKVSIQLTNQKNFAKCSLVINGISNLQSHMLEDILEDEYGQFLLNIGQDNQQLYWQLLKPNRDISILSLYPNSDINNAANIELARNFEILPIRTDAPLSQSDLDTYMKNEGHLSVFSLRLFSTAPFWKNWVKQIERFPLIQKTEGASNAGDTILYLMSREPKLEFRLIDGLNANMAIMLLDINKVDITRLISAYEKRLPLFFEYVEKQTPNNGESALWRVARNNIIQDIAIEPIVENQIITITFYTRLITQ